MKNLILFSKKMYFQGNNLISIYLNNYSYIEMFHYITTAMADQQALRQVKDVLVAFLMRHGTEIGYSDVIIY